MQLLELARDHRARPRRVGDEDHRGAFLTRAHQRVAGGRKGGKAVVHHTPYVAKQCVVVRRKRREMREQRRRSHEYQRAAVASIWASTGPAESAAAFTACSASARTGRGAENRNPWPKRTS